MQPPLQLALTLLVEEEVEAEEFLIAKLVQVLLLLFVSVWGQVEV